MLQHESAFIRTIRLLACTLPLAIVAYGTRVAAAEPPPPPPVATTIVNYDFNAGSSYGALTPALAGGTSSVASSTQPFATFTGGATDAGAFTANATAGRGLALSDSSGTNSQYFQFQLSGASLPFYRHYKVYVQAFRFANAATTLTLAYSTNGTTFTNVPTTLSPGLGTYVSQVFDLSSVTALGHQSTVYFRLLASGATLPNSAVLIDNFQIQAEVVSCPTTLTVDNRGDAADADPGDGVCAAGDGACTLRAALMESNASAFCATQTINVIPQGTIALASGLPTITRPVTIQGPGANLLALSGNNTFRLVNILLTTPGTVTINDLGFTNGGKGAGENATALEFNNVGSLVLNRDEFYGNTGPAGSSVLFSNAAVALTMNGSTVRNNAVEHVIVIGNTPFTIANSTIASNTGTGGAVFIFGGVPSATIESSTITNNNQGLWHANTAGSSTVTIRNSIFSQNGNLNLRRSPNNISCSINGIVSGGYNLIDDTPGPSLCSSTATDQIGASVAPQLTPLGYYGGTTQTRLPALTSPAIDKGRAFGQTLDQRGSRRAYDKAAVANAPGGDGTDIGAVELGFLVNSLADTGDATPDGECDNGSGVCTLREAIQEANALADGDTISVAAGLTGTIVLGSGLPTIIRPITILGPGANQLAVSGNNTFRLMNVLLAAPGAVTINDLGFTNGGKGAGENATALEFNNVGSLVLNRDEFYGNTGPGGSSVIFSNAAAGLTMMGSTVRDNAVEHVIVIGNTPFQIVNSTIASNTGTGGAVFIFGGVPSATIESSTITNNTQGLWHANAAGSSTVTIRNSIFSQNGNLNLRRSPGDISCSINGIVSGGYNVIDDTPGPSLCSSTATDQIGASVAPQLTPLGYYGGPTRTRALMGGSPAIDRGSRFGVAIDARGQARPFDNPSVAPASGGDNSDVGAFELQTACGAVTLSPATLPNWNTSVGYQQQLTADGAGAPYTFSVVSGSLPPGMTLGPGGGLTGAPVATGTFTFTVLATSANGCYGIRSYTITVSACTAIAVNPTSVPSGIVGTAYSQALLASGGIAPYTFSAAGTLPPGVTLSSAGLLSGTPSAAGSFAFTAVAAASNGCTTAQGYTAVVLARPTGLSLSNASVAENSPSATAVGTLSTTDADSSTFTYALVSGPGSADNASFTISGSQLQTNAIFDAETKSSYSVRVRTTDPDSLTFEQTFTIAVVNVNESPTNVTLSAAAVAENSVAGATVGTFSTADPDAGAMHTYTLVSGTGGDDNALFAIAGNALQINAAADFETKSSYSVRVRSTDQDGLFFEKAFVIAVTNVNEPPTGISLSASTVTENNAVGATVGTLSTTDPDAGSVHTYTLVSGTGGDDNALFAIAGNALQINAAADFETKASYTVRVRSTDAGNLFFEKAFVIAVTNVNEPPTGISLSASTVTENNAAGLTVGSLSTTDPDAGAAHTYTLVPGTGGDDNALFAIAGNALTINVTTDFETKPSYGIRVRSSDQGGLVFEKAFVIAVTNANEPPTISDLPNQAVVAGRTIGPVAFTIGDPETAAGALTVTATSSNATLVPNDPAHIVFAGSGASRTVTITPAALLTGTTTIAVTVSDGTATATDEFVVTVRRRSRPDFDGDGRTDMTLYRGDGRWMILKSSSGYSSSMIIDWGGAGYLPVAGDYDGDGTTDPAVYSVADGRWLALESHTNFTTLFSRSLGGGAGVRPVPGDYDGDGRTDPAVYETATGQWRILQSGSGYASLVVAAGIGTPVPGMDIDGDGASDIATFTERTMTWRVFLSGTAFGSPLSGPWGSRGGTLVPGDYDGDGKTDPAVYEPASGKWLVLKSSDAYTSSLAFNWGGLGYEPVPGDYDGDGKSDLAIVQRSTGNWYVLESRNGFTTTISASNFGGPAVLFVHGAVPTRSVSDMMRASDVDGDRVSDLTAYNAASGQWVSRLSTSPGFDATVSATFGGAGYTAVPGDYDGDGKTDRATYHAATGNWSVLLSSTNGATTLSGHAGGAGDVPVPGDYDGDGRTDFAVYNTTSGLWYALKSSANYATAVSIAWGGPGYTAAPADFDGDGATDLALYVPATGTWYVLLSRTGFTTSVSRNVGGAGYVPVPGDYDGDGLADFAVYQTTTGLWYGLKSTSAYTITFSIGWGGTGYAPFRIDADGDGRMDLGVYDGNGTWYVLLSGLNFTTSLVRSSAGAGGIALPQ